MFIAVALFNYHIIELSILVKKMLLGYFLIRFCINYVFMSEEKENNKILTRPSDKSPLILGVNQFS